MKKLIKLCVFFLFGHVVSVHASCSYSEMIVDFKGLKLLSSPNGYVIPKNQTSSIIPSGDNAVLYCEGGFEWYDVEGYLTHNAGKSLTIYCDDDVMLYSTEHNSNKERFSSENGPFVMCKSFSANFYGGKLEHCDYDGLRHGIYIKNVPIESLQLCHDFNESEPIFTHYIAARRSIVLANQVGYNPSNVKQTDLSPQARLKIVHERPPEIFLENEYTLFIPSLKHLLYELDYKYSELTPSILYQSLNIQPFKYDFGTWNSVPWWTPLRMGNWKVFQKILSRQVEKETYRIYAGKSHRASFPDDFVCNSETDMTFDFDGRKKYIPLYIWNYIIPRWRDEDNQEFVLLGVNSPFVKTKANNSVVICEDICDKISWLKPLEATRKMPTFGYMFCCKPEEVSTLLQGFPFTKVKRY